jgi:hypothetical protein
VSVLNDALKFGKDLMLLKEHVDQLTTARKDSATRLEDHERRLIRIETLIEFSRSVTTPRLSKD